MRKFVAYLWKNKMITLSRFTRPWLFDKHATKRHQPCARYEPVGYFTWFCNVIDDYPLAETQTRHSPFATARYTVKNNLPNYQKSGTLYERKSFEDNPRVNFVRGKGITVLRSMNASARKFLNLPYPGCF